MRSASATSSPPLAAERLLQVRTAAGRDAIARVAYAEAGNQGDSGLAAVVYTILNRLQDGRWGDTIDSVLNARAQFEPVLRAGGDWRALPAVSSAAQARIDTILNLALDGRLPDLTNGARYFQNPAIVAGRSRAGQVAPSLVNFGGQAPSAVIGAHSFYVGSDRGGQDAVLPAHIPRRTRMEATLFVGENRAQLAVTEPDHRLMDVSSASPTAGQAGDPSQALFVSRDGVVRDRQP
ncbi:MAG TPA: cell wall hydrolase [Caulobacteraceae bacterium]|nr:cell wall hydrolase [Caulobacteraceae bacterium]